jgi:hypothetical protein
MRHYFRTVVLGLAGCLVPLVACQGQGLSNSYEPLNPTISPYLNLLRFDRGPLPNYYSLVRPQLRQQAFNRDATRAIQHNLRQLSTIERAAAAAVGQEGGIRLQQSGVRPTGVSGQFQSFSHYFPAPQATRNRR